MSKARCCFSRGVSCACPPPWLHTFTFRGQKHSLSLLQETPVWAKRPNPALVQSPQQPLTRLCHGLCHATTTWHCPQAHQLTLTEALSCYSSAGRDRSWARGGHCPRHCQLLPLPSGGGTGSCLACTTEHPELPEGKRKGSVVLGHHSWGAVSSRCPFLQKPGISLSITRQWYPGAELSTKSLWKHHCHSYKCTKYCLEINIILLQYVGPFLFFFKSQFSDLYSLPEKRNINL